MEESGGEVPIGPGGRREIGRGGGWQETRGEARRDARRDARREGCKRESGPIGIRGRKGEGGKQRKQINKPHKTMYRKVS